MKGYVRVAPAVLIALFMGSAADARAPAPTVAPNNDAGISAPRNPGPGAGALEGSTHSEESPNLGQTLSDAAITTSVKSKLISNAITSGRNIKVTTENGVVILSGHVRSAAEKSAAAQIASDTKGVKSVRNALLIGRGS